MAKIKRDRRREARRNEDKGRRALHYVESEGEIVLVGVRWSLSRQPMPRRIRRAS